MTGYRIRVYHRTVPYVMNNLTETVRTFRTRASAENYARLSFGPHPPGVAHLMIKKLSWNVEKALDHRNDQR